MALDFNEEASRRDSISVLHVVGGLDRRYGGPSYSVPSLARAQALAGAMVAITSVAEVGGPSSNQMHDGYLDIRSRWSGSAVPLLSKLRYSKEFRPALVSIGGSVDVVHNHGLWLHPNIIAGRFAQRAAKPLILSPRGMLAPEALAFSRSRKCLFWHFFQRPALRALSCVHVTSLQERDEVRAVGLNGPVALVPNGVDIPVLPTRRPSSPDGCREVLFLGRLHPKKSVDMLIEAWAGVSPDTRAGWRLRIVGPSEGGYGEELSRLTRRLKLSDVSFERPIWGAERTLAYLRADLFVLPTRNENFGLTIAEALAAGTPVITTRGAPWAGLREQRCGWWLEYGINPLKSTLETALKMSRHELQSMGSRGRAWIAGAFSWEAAAKSLNGVARWLKHGGPRPDCILRD